MTDPLPMLRYRLQALQASWSELVQAQQALQRALYLPTAFVTFE